MELMSFLLLYALVAFLPQVLGKSSIKYTYDSGFNDSLIIKKKPTIGKNIFVNRNAPSLINKVTDMQTIFMHPNCRGCYGCMERAIKAHKMHNHMMDPRISVENLQDDRNMEIGNRRDKRKTRIENMETKMERKSKKNKTKRNKSITMVKYNENDKVYALKIKETNTFMDQYNKSKTVTTCQVYSVEKSFSCESPDANLILADSRKRNIKKNKKGHGKREISVPQVKATAVTPMYIKRQVDNSQVPEQIMPSIEEMY